MDDAYQAYGKEHGLFDEKAEDARPEKAEVCPRCGGEVLYKRKRGKARKLHKKRHCNLNVCDKIMTS